MHNSSIVCAVLVRALCKVAVLSSLVSVFLGADDTPGAVPLYSEKPLFECDLEFPGPRCSIQSSLLTEYFYYYFIKIIGHVEMQILFMSRTFDSAP